MGKKKKKTIPSIKEEKRVPIVFHIPGTIITRFATNITVQVIENEFKISFFEQKPEIYFEPTPPPSEVHAECVASVIVTADRLPKFIEALLRQVEIYSSRKQEIKE